MTTAKKELDHGVTRRFYVAHELSSFLLADSISDKGDNIGSHGEGLTIAFLSFNSANLSERLCTSIAECIPNFAGEVLAIDRGSAPQELERLREALAKLPFRTRLVEFGEDKGVTAARNSMTRHVKTQWVMCLDSHVYFIRNPLVRIQSDLSTLGCRFLGLPLLEADQKTLSATGDLLHISYDNLGNVSVRGGSAYKPMVADTYDAPGFLSSFMSGKACVFDVEAFKNIGGYDEALSAGLEDTDLSIRLFRMGYKVGTTGATALVHDEPWQESNSKAIEEAARHFENKYGYRSFTRTPDQQVKPPASPASGLPQSESVPAAVRTKPNVALVVDIEHWAFYNIATQVKRNLGDKFEFDIIPSREIGGDLRLMLMMEGYDLVHFFWRGSIHVLKSPYMKRQLESVGFDPGEIYQRCILGRPTTTSVYDHLFLRPDEIEAKAHIFQNVTGYTVSSERLNRIYSKLEGYPPPTAVITDGVDLDLFHPKKVFSPDADRPLVVGWAGNSAWAADIEDYKGFQTILRPALAELVEEGVPFVGHFADRQIRMIPHREMPDYYSQIDVFVCSSKIEGTPNPVLEAMACGVPVISTDVGIVPEAFGPKQHEFILQERSKECLKKALRRLHEDRALLKELSEENLSSIQAWAWPEKARLFGPFFEQMMAKFHASK